MVSSDADYGPISVVMVLLSYLVGLAVRLHLGAVGRALVRVAGRSLRCVRMMPACLLPVQVNVLLVCGYSVGDRIWAADQLKPG